jgi:hypothetical protein
LLLVVVVVVVEKEEKGSGDGADLNNGLFTFKWGELVDVLDVLDATL